MLAVKTGTFCICKSYLKQLARNIPNGSLDNEYLGHSINSSNTNKGTHRVPTTSQSLTLTRRQADFTLRKQYFTAPLRNFTRSQERISPRA